MKRNLGRLESQLLALAQMRKTRTLATGDLTGPLRLEAKQERELFSRMARGGLIARVRQGLYLIPPRLPLAGAWTPGEAEALNTLMRDAQGRYQICGPNAFNFYGFDNQVPVRVYAYNNRISGERKIGAVEITLIKVADARLGDTTMVSTSDEEQAVYSSRVRSLVDAVYDWSRFNGIPRGYQWIERELKAGRVRPAELVTCTLRYGDTGTIRRMGVLLERQGVDNRLLRKLERVLTPTSGPIPWIPAKPKRGLVDRRWGVVMNDRT
jgi:predicted transcriptional regulator of viral defense system